MDYIAWSTRKKCSLILPETEYTRAHPELIEDLKTYDFLDDLYYLVPQALYTIVQTLSRGEALSERAEQVLEICLFLVKGWEEGFCPSCYVPTFDDPYWEKEDRIYDAGKDLYYHSETAGWFRHTAGSGRAGGNDTCEQCAAVGVDEMNRGISARAVTHPSEWSDRGIRPLKP